MQGLFKKLSLIFVSIAVLAVIVLTMIGVLSGDILAAGDVGSYFLEHTGYLYGLGTLAVLALLSFVFEIMIRMQGNDYSISHTHHVVSKAVRTEFQTKCQEAQLLMQKATPSSYRSAVVLMDNLLDKALELKGFTGTTGEKLKISGGLFNDPDRVWHAHKHRNLLVHEINYEATRVECQKSVDDFIYALTELDVLPKTSQK
jgi:hypothetical protein